MSTTLSNALAGGTCCLSKAGVAAGTTTTTTIALTNYAIGGRMFSKAAATNGATPTVDAATGAAFVPLTAGKSCIFVYALDAAGALKAVQGPLVNGADVTGKLSAVQFPVMPGGMAAIGYLYAQAGSTLVGTWTFGANNMAGVTGMTYTFADLFAIPAQPLAA